VTGKVDIDWAVDNNNFLYAFVATGHRAAGLNGDGTPFNGEDVTDYEAGWKGTFFDGHVATQLGGYYDNYDDFVMSFFDPLNALGLSGGEDLNITGTTVLKGIEAQVQAAFDGLSVNAGVSYEDSALPTFFAQDARFTLGGPCDHATGPAAPFPINCVNLGGRTLPNAPKWTAQFGVQYVIDLGDDHTLTPRLDYGFVSSQWGSVFQVTGNPLLPVDRLAARNLLNGQITYDFADKWKVVAYGTNLTDLHYVATELLGKLGFPGPPRQFGLRVSKAF
jgi:iron complex outermembrane receptor protein